MFCPFLSGKNIQTSLFTELYTPPQPTSFPLVDDLPSTDTQEPFNDSWGGNATWIGRRCWPIFQALSMKNSCFETSILRQKTAFCAIRSRDVYNSQTPSARPWPQSAKSSVRKPWKKSPRSSNLQRFSPGNVSSPLPNLTAPPSANRPDVLVLRKNSRIWLSRWPRRIVVGATIG